jgi:hypothetical protein
LKNKSSTHLDYVAEDENPELKKKKKAQTMISQSLDEGMYLQTNCHKED